MMHKLRSVMGLRDDLYVLTNECLNKNKLFKGITIANI
jgi:hypothetical protein